MAEIRGETTIAVDVLNQIAGHVAGTIDGIHQLGKGSLMSKLRGERARGAGVMAAVGTEEAAFDLEVVLAYGFPLKEVTGKLRDAIAHEVKQMLDRTVVEININVVGVHFPEEEKADTQRVK